LTRRAPETVTKPPKEVERHLGFRRVVPVDRGERMVLQMTEPARESAQRPFGADAREMLVGRLQPLGRGPGRLETDEMIEQAPLGVGALEREGGDVGEAVAVERERR